MDIKVNEVNSYTRELDILIPWEELKNDFEKAIKHFAKKVKLPGFRPGKVPRKVLMKNYLPNIEMDFVEDSFNRFYAQALQEKNLIPVNQGEIADLRFHYETDLSFKATFEIEPEVALPALKKNSLKVQRTKYTSDDEDIEIAIDDIRTRYMNRRTIEDGSKEGHFIVCDLQEIDDSGAPIIGNKMEERYIKVGDGMFTGDLQKALTGLKAGDVTQIAVPGGDPGDTKYQLTVTRVESHELPEVDEDFVKMVDPAVETVEALREKIKESIDLEYERRSEEAFNRQLSDALIDMADIEYPPSMVESYLNHLIEDVKKANPDADLDDEKVRETYKSLALRNMKWYLLRKAIIREQNLEITKEEVLEEVKRLIERSPQYAKEIEKYYKKPSNREKIEDDLMEKKILEYLEGFAKIKEVKVQTKDLREQKTQEG